MSVIYIVLPLAILMAMVAVGAFLWAVHRGQFDDLEVPAYRVLFEEDSVPGASTKSQASDSKQTRSTKYEGRGS